MRPSRHPGGPFASAGEGRGAPSDPAVRDQAVSARPGVPSGVMISRFPALLGSRTPPIGAVGIPAAAPVTLRVRRAGCRHRGPRTRRFPWRRAPAVLVGAGLSAADDPFQHGQDALRGTLDDPDVRSFGLSSRRGLGAVRGVADGSREAAVAWRVGWSGPGRAAGVARAVGIGRGRRPDRAGPGGVGSRTAVSRPAC